jgi:hypothetical protein
MLVKKEREQKSDYMARVKQRALEVSEANE